MGHEITWNECEITWKGTFNYGITQKYLGYANLTNLCFRFSVNFLLIDTQKPHFKSSAWAFRSLPLLIQASNSFGGPKNAILERVTPCIDVFWYWQISRTVKQCYFIGTRQTGKNVTHLPEYFSFSRFRSSSYYCLHRVWSNNETCNALFWCKIENTEKPAERRIFLFLGLQSGNVFKPALREESQIIYEDTWASF